MPDWYCKVNSPNELDAQIREIAKENQTCSLCAKSWLEAGVNPEVALFGGGVREAT